MRALAASIALVCGCAVEPGEPLGDPHGLPSCASPQVDQIFKAVRSYIPKGSVTDQNFVTAANHADEHLYLDGPQIFPAMRELIAGAQRDVNLQTYVWEPGSDPANEILDGLAELNRNRMYANATSPVTVRFLFDVSTTSYGSRVDALPLTWAAVEALKLDPRFVKFELAGVARSATGALHKKTLVVDGKLAFITGANPQAHHNYAAPWRDAGYRLDGEVALALQDDFDATWAAGMLWTCAGDVAGKWSACSAATQAIVREPVATTATAEADACQTMLVATRVADSSPLANSTDNPSDQAFIAAMGAATDHVRIQTPNLNDDAAKKAIVDAVKRGVRVDVVLSKGFNDSTEVYPGQGGTNEDNVQMLYDTLGAAGVPDKCDKLRFRWYTRNGVVVDGNGLYASHAKYMSLDDSIVIVGTSNMDTQSWNNSREINVVVDDPAITQAWDRQMFVPEMAAGEQVDYCK
ncbi:MAG TPA: phosphatidylserine/phosphatidylglycerophosphate/cardiolipin synthase family protein [Kofleriaceae bacterium]|nr:phosphatidylserine/phosphatidylglycerophosphate/cardiolipin synthase family protein [Kofleriaceae bacterium]